MDLIVTGDGWASWGGQRFRCAIGRSGIVPAAAKREGDGATPAGRWRLRQVYYRADRLAPPATMLPVMALQPDDGWCDAPADANYNCLVKHPYPASAEHLWRDDRLYDVIGVLSHNMSPVVPNLGSAIFFHVADPAYAASNGCITLSLPDLLTVLSEATADSAVSIDA